MNDKSCEFCGGEFYKINGGYNLCAKCWNRLGYLYVFEWETPDEMKSFEECIEILRNENKQP